MNQPALVIMAAGMGSRFGGLEQIVPVDEQGYYPSDNRQFPRQLQRSQRP